jgi:heme A synthase
MNKRFLNLWTVLALALVLMAGCTSTKPAVSYGNATETDGATLIIDAILYVVSFDGGSVDEGWRGTVSSFGNKSAKVIIPAGQHSLVIKDYKSQQEFSQVFEAGVTYTFASNFGTPVLKTK